MNTFKQKKAGFTLIELLVVISIIALLSSVVLAGVQVAREKARATAFRANVDQFVKALEMYKNTTGHYPLEDISTNEYGGFTVINDSSGTLTATAVSSGLDGAKSTGAEFSTLMAPYIKKMPIPINTGDFFYYKQKNVDMGSTPSSYKCVGYGDGNSTHPPYVITVTNSKGFEDWPLVSQWTQTGLGGSWTTGTEKCFTLK